MTAKTMAEVLARALYVAAHWQDTISEPDGQGKPQSEYERRAGERWDAGKAGWANYQRYPRYAKAGTDALSAAGFGLVADAKAEALSEAAERFKQRSDTYHNTMQEMAASREYGLEDIVRYGAYSAEANTTATWLRTQAAKTRATS